MQIDAVEMDMPFPRKLFERVVDELNGRIPLCVQVLREGTFVPKGTPFAQISNTVEGFGELVSLVGRNVCAFIFPIGLRDYGL